MHVGSVDEPVKLPGAAHETMYENDNALISRVFKANWRMWFIHYRRPQSR
jgi:hypothetical protein